MNKIVLEDYPVDRLPEDIQRQIADAKEVTLTVEVAEAPADRRKVTLEDIFKTRQPPYLTAEEIIKEIHQGRYDDP